MTHRWRNVVVPAVLAALLGLVLATTPQGSASAQLPDPRGRVFPSANPVPGQFIVTLRDAGATSVDTTVAALTQRHGGDVLAVYDTALQGYAVATTAAGAEELAKDPAVAAVEQDGYVEAQTTQAPAPSWGLDRIDQPALPLDNSYEFTTGAPSVHVYVVDSGINVSLSEFGGRATGGPDLVGGINPPSSDCYGHGTHVAGTIGSATYGVAKAVHLVAVRVLNCNGSGSFSNVIAGLDWVAANAVKPAVVNMSLSGPRSDTLDNAVVALIASGIPTTVAAGNKNANACNSSPSSVAAALVVGATDQADVRSTFSNFGTCVDVFAPGTGITSTWAFSPFTRVVSGTSMAAPHVAGVAAQFLELNQTATPAQVASAILANASNGVVGNAGAGSPSALLHGGFIASGPPDPPVLSATSSNGVVNLSWTLVGDGGSPITKFTVARGLSAGSETTLATIQSPPLTSYVDSAVTEGTTYYYTVTAENGAGPSEPSNEVSATPPPPNPNPGWEPLGGEFTDGPAVAAWSEGRLDIFTRGTDGQLWHKWFDHGWSDWETLGGEFTDGPAVAAWSEGRLDIFTRGTDGQLWHKWFDRGWSDWETLGGEFTDGPAVAAWSEGRLDIFTRGTDGQLWHKWFDHGWSDWETLGGEFTDGPAVAAWSEGRLDIFTRGTDGQLWHKWFDHGWSDWEPLGGTFLDRPAVDAWSAGRLDVFVRAIDGQVFQKTFDLGWRNWAPLGGTFTDGPAVAAWSQGRLDVFTRGTDGQLWHKWFDGAWS